MPLDVSHGINLKETSEIQPKVEIIIRENSFEPSKELDYYQPNLLLIVEGTEVTWKNQDSEDHTVTSGTSIAGSDGKFDSRLIFPDDSFSYTLNDTGEFGYFCKIHPWMNGAIVVAPKSIFNISSKEFFSQGENIELVIDVKLNLKNTYYFPKGAKSALATIIISDTLREINTTKYEITEDTATDRLFYSRNESFWSSNGPYIAQLKLETNTAELLSFTKFNFEKQITPQPIPSFNIPDWIKNNAGWWAEGLVSDSEFVNGIQFLIKEGIMKIPPTTSGSGTGSDEIPSWIKNNAGWWSEGLISDNDFVQGIQHLIKNGIMRIDID